MEETVKIYTIPTCSDCNYAKRYFKENEIPYTDFNCADDPKYPEEVWNLTGKQIVPTIMIRDMVFVGFSENLSEISGLFYKA
ncbi:glutaredoxin family protein [Paenibacillus sp. 2TAB23]|uniref:glutaredoxin family protein n=1 Tax=Paenibacillus sp. 2TAB23 TaxID=3233004 RepID=UPI003F94CBF6